MKCQFLGELQRTKRLISLGDAVGIIGVVLSTIQTSFGVVGLLPGEDLKEANLKRATELLTKIEKNMQILVDEVKSELDRREYNKYATSIDLFSFYLETHMKNLENKLAQDELASRCKADGHLMPGFIVWMNGQTTKLDGSMYDVFSRETDFAKLTAWKRLIIQRMGQAILIYSNCLVVTYNNKDEVKEVLFGPRWKQNVTEGQVGNWKKYVNNIISKFENNPKIEASFRKGLLEEIDNFTRSLNEKKPLDKENVFLDKFYQHLLSIDPFRCYLVATSNSDPVSKVINQGYKSNLVIMRQLRKGNPYYRSVTVVYLPWSECWINKGEIAESCTKSLNCDITHYAFGSYDQGIIRPECDVKHMKIWFEIVESSNFQFQTPHAITPEKITHDKNIILCSGGTSRIAPELNHEKFNLGFAIKQRMFETTAYQDGPSVFKYYWMIMV